MSGIQKQKRATYHLYTFLISKLISSLGANVYAFGISMYILSMTGSALSFAANLAFSIIPRMLLSPVAGILSDRISKKALVLGGVSLSLLSLAGLLVYSLLVAFTLPAIYVTTALYTIGITFSSISFTASIASLVDEDRIQKALSFNQLSLSLAGIGGPMIGGMLFGFVSIESFLLVNILSYSIALLLDATMKFNLYAKRNINEEGQVSILHSFKEGMLHIKTNPLISKLLIVMLWLNLFFSSVSVGINFILMQKLKVEYSLIGFIEAAGAVGMFLAALYFAITTTVKYPLLFSKRAVLGMSGLVGAFSVPLFFHFSTNVQFLYYLFVMFLFGACSVLTNTPIGVMLQKDVDEAYRGRILGIIEMTAMGLMPVGSLLFGFLFDHIPAQIIFILCSISMIIIICWFLPPSLIQTVYPTKAKKFQNASSAEKNLVMLEKEQLKNEYRQHAEEQKRMSNPTNFPF